VPPEDEQVMLKTCKGKAHPLQAMQAQRGLGELRLLDFTTSALYGGRLSASRTGRPYTQGHPWYSFSLGAESPQGHGLVGRKYVTEKSSDTTGNRSRDRPTSSTLTTTLPQAHARNM
jgi:hypothetical protein